MAPNTYIRPGRCDIQNGCVVVKHARGTRERLVVVVRCEQKPHQSTSPAADPGGVEARMEAAKMYRIQQKNREQQEEEDTVDEVSATFSPYAERVTASDTHVFLNAQKDIVDASSGTDNDTEYNVTIERGFGDEWTRTSVQKVDGVVQRRGGAGGSRDEAASWLPTSSSAAKEGIDTSLRAEEFTLEKEKRIREQDVVIERAKGVVSGTNRKETRLDEYGIAQQIQDAELSIAKDKEDMNKIRKQQEGNDASLHKPKVATWGVFPRPQNISKTYGGGRNIRPGQVLETEEEAAERKKRIDQALNEYRKAAGLDVDPVVEDRATRLYEEGQVLFDSGSIRGALDKFSEAADMVPLKSKIGGLANLQKAVCLDSLGRNDEAYPIYKSLRGHSAPGVAKNSKRMLFGFKAAKELKVDTMRYNAGSVDQWRGYFDRATDSTWTVYKQSQDAAEEDEEEERTLALVATVVMLAPLVFVGLLATQ